jgi:AcrR family transcriptional regulator
MSRQSIYVHFRSKARLLLELVDYVDESEGVPRLTDRIDTAASGEEALDLFIDLVARLGPRIFRVSQHSTRRATRMQLRQRPGEIALTVGDSGAEPSFVDLQRRAGSRPSSMSPPRRTYCGRWPL